MDMDWLFALSRMGKYWREGRKLLDRSFRSGATASHRRLIEEKTRVFLGQLLATPKAFREHIYLLVPLPCCPITVDSHCSLQGKLVMRLTYGYDLKENDDMLTPPKRIAEIMKQFFFPGAALVNHLPFRAVPLFPTVIRVSHGYIQSGASLRGFLCSNMNHWRVNVGSWDGG